MTPGDRARLSVQARELRASGMAATAIARTLGVSRGFVDWHCLPPDVQEARREARKGRYRDEPRVLRVCPGCGDEAWVARSSWNKVLAGVRGPHCRPCGRAVAAGKPLPSRPAPVSAAALSGFGPEEAKEWAVSVWRTMTSAERDGLRRAFAAMGDIPVPDHSTYARGPKRDRDRAKDMVRFGTGGDR